MKAKNRVRWSAVVQSWNYLQSLPTTTRCYELSDAQASALLSICEYLGWPNRYSDENAPQWSETNEFRASVEGALNAPRECETMRLRQSLLNPCLLQASYDGGETWETAFNYSLCSMVPDDILLRWTVGDGYTASFDSGATWQSGAMYDPRASAATFPQPPVGSGQTARCLAANNVIAELKANVQSVHAELQGGSGVVGISGVFSALMVLLFATAPIAGLVWAISGAASAVIGYSANAFLAAFPKEFWDGLFTIVYCASNDEMSYDQAAFNTLYEEVAIAFNGIAAIHIQNVLALMGPVGLTNTARINHGVYVDEFCACNEWCYTFDFTTTDGGWQQWFGQGANYQSGIGWQAITRSDGSKGLEIIRYFDASTVTDIEVTLVSDNVTSANLYIGTDPGGWNVTDAQINGTHTYTHNGLALIGVTSLLINAAAAAATQITVTAVTLKGTGTNPFGGNNCQ